jgi:Fe-S cluster biogenesis protein NfuA
METQEQKKPEIKIIGEPSESDPSTCKFTVDRVVYEGPAIRFSNPESAKRSPLAKRIFGIGSILSVLVSGKEITVSKNDTNEWEKIGKSIGAEIRAFLYSGEPVLTEAAPDAEEAASDTSLRGRVQKVIEELVNPGVASHGGYVNLVDVKGNDIYIFMGGGCQGCGMSKMTLKMGITETIKEEVPEVGEVFDVTDHQAGQTPYYE